MRLGIEAPRETRIYREEVYQAIQRQNTIASQAGPEELSKLSEELKKK